MKKISLIISLIFTSVTGILTSCSEDYPGPGSSSNLVVISFLFQLSSSFLILLKVVDMFAF